LGLEEVSVNQPLPHLLLLPPLLSPDLEKRLDLVLLVEA
jgi:hypothetical protein